MRSSAAFVFVIFACMDGARGLAYEPYVEIPRPEYLGSAVIQSLSGTRSVVWTGFSADDEGPGRLLGGERPSMEAFFLAMSDTLLACSGEEKISGEALFEICTDEEGFVTCSNRVDRTTDLEYYVPPRDAIAECVEAEMLSRQLPLSTPPANGAACLSLKLAW